jgi:hypothetical protein
MANYRVLKEKIDNHRKLLSMISDNLVPLKQVLLDDVKDISKYLEIASKQDRKVEDKK